jgi:hypothetical protein
MKKAGCCVDIVTPTTELPIRHENIKIGIQHSYHMSSLTAS